MDNFENNHDNELRHLLEGQENKVFTKKKNINRIRIPIIFVIIISLISGFGGGALSIYFAPKILKNSLGMSPQNNIEIVTKDAELNTAAAVAEKVMPSVVGIATEVVYSSFFGQQRSEGVGTGVIVDKSGYILTNSHVVNNGEMRSIKVLLHDGREVEGNLLWNDAVIDLAIVKIEADNLVPAELGDADKVKVGEFAVAIGNPLGFQFERTVTSGIISGLNRTIPISNYESIEGLIQTDASINPGNSGGPLLNQYGQVIGINTAKIQSGEGLGFAIPINIAQPIVNEFIEKGEFRKAYIGIRAVNVEQYLQSFDEDLGVDKGVYIYQTFINSPASKADISEGDVITKIEDKEIATMTQLVNELYQYRPGDKIKVEIVRNKEKKEIFVSLEATPENF